MSNENPEEISPEFKKAINSVGVKLVQLGLATRTVVRDNQGMVHIQFTREGKILQDQISRIFDAVNKGERFDFYELQAFMAIMAMKQFDQGE